jgi:ribosome-binding protein aMBF1 (putative translation factor)
MKELREQLLANPKVRVAYEELAPEYELARVIICARVRSGLTQAQLAERMRTSQSFIARLESGRTVPNLKTLKRVGEATGTRVKVDLVAAWRPTGGA